MCVFTKPTLRCNCQSSLLQLQAAHHLDRGEVEQDVLESNDTQHVQLVPRLEIPIHHVVRYCM